MDGLIMTIDETISQFLLDGQFRISELAIQKENIGDIYDPESLELDRQMYEIYLLMDVLYIGTIGIVDGYNLCGWSDAEIESAIEWVRNHTGMNTSPYVDFVGNYPQIVNNITEGGDGGGVSFPLGAVGDFLYYFNNNTSPSATPFPVIVGQSDSDTINTYFAGR
jgi:hypothetical protein